MSEKPKTVIKKEKKAENSYTKIAVVRIRGDVKLSPDVRKTFELLNLHNKNYCVVVEKNPSNLGMVKRVNDYVTWGEISDEFYKELVEKKGETYNNRIEDSKKKIQYNKYFTFNKTKYKKYFRLMPPVKGYGPEGIKKPFSKNGALGYRKDKISQLITRMM
ncbi:MAG: uL30 family ribosomal protein [Nanoarchaeota archaeon]